MNPVSVVRIVTLRQGELKGDMQVKGQHSIEVVKNSRALTKLDDETSEGLLDATMLCSYK